MEFKCGMVIQIFYMNWLEGILYTPDDSDIGYSVEVDFKYPEKIKKLKKFPFGPENKIIPKKIFND